MLERKAKYLVCSFCLVLLQLLIVNRLRYFQTHEWFFFTSIIFSFGIVVYVKVKSFHVNVEVSVVSLMEKCEFANK